MAEKFTLDSGLRVVVEYMPHLHSVSTGVWVDAGSVSESHAGATHYLEHLLFKGTESRSALEIAAAMERVGGMLNAFTGKEHTCFYTRCLDEHFGLSLELLSDMLHHSLFAPDEVERERGVIIEEINMYEDSPDDLVMDRFCSALWPDHGYGRSISGTIEDVSGLPREALLDYWQSSYIPSRMVLSVAGNIRPEQVLEAAQRLFPAQSGLARPAIAPPQPAARRIVQQKDIEQEHICLGFPGLAMDDPDVFAAAVAVNTLGGGASSRLFQEVREKRGLAYSAYAYADRYTQGGYVAAYAASQPSKAQELIRVMAGEFSRLAEQGLSGEEIRRSQDQIRGNLMLSLESSGTRMTRLGLMELHRGLLFDAEDWMNKLMAVREDDVRRVLARILRPGTMVLSQVGPDPCEIDPKELF